MARRVEEGAELEGEGEENGRRVITWKFCRNLDDGSLGDRVMAKVENALQTAFYLRYTFTCLLEDIETGEEMLYDTNLGGPPNIFTRFEEARAWLNEIGRLSHPG